jgi:hypothetical protein
MEYVMNKRAVFRFRVYSVNTENIVNMQTVVNSLLIMNCDLCRL